MAKSKYPNDDLFEGTKMSFGEHLEELRVCLFKAVIGVVIGFAVGLCIAGYVVDWIQSPLKSAMEEHALAKAVKELEVKFGKESLSPAIKDFIIRHRVVFEDAYVESQELARLTELLRTQSQPPAAAAAVPATDVEKEKQEEGEAKGEKGSEPAIPEPKDDSSIGKSPIALAAREAATLSTADAASREIPQLSFVGDKPPTPSPEMIRTRYWRPIKLSVTSLRADEAFMIWMKAGLIAGLVLSSPYVFIQVWKFIAAGLYPHEKKYVHFYLPFSLFLFLSGAGLAFGFVFKPVLRFLFSFNESMNIGIDARISEWLGFVLILPLGFGLSFQLPLVMLFLNRIGIVSLEMYMAKWRIAILAVFVISMVLTPADPISMLLMAIPLTGLYFLGVGLCKWMPRGRNPFAEAYEP